MALEIPCLLGQTDSHAPMLFDMAQHIAEMKRNDIKTSDSLSPHPFMDNN